MEALGGVFALVVGAEQQLLLALVPVEVLLLPLHSCRGVRLIEGSHGPPLADAVSRPPVTPTIDLELVIENVPYGTECDKKFSIDYLHFCLRNLYIRTHIQFFLNYIHFPDRTFG